MPYKYVGKTSNQCGKTLWEILGNLKNFGVGRIIVRNQDVLKYPEVCFMKILKVEPKPHKPDVVRKVICLVEEVFRGMKADEIVQIQASTFKPDFRLIPRHKEAEFYNGIIPKDKITYNTYPRSAPMLPIMKELIKRQHKAAGLPVTEEDLTIPLKYSNQGLFKTYRVCEEGEEPSVKGIDFSLGQVIAPRLYKTTAEIAAEAAVKEAAANEAAENEESSEKKAESI